MGSEMLRCAQHDRMLYLAAPGVSCLVTLSEAKGLFRPVERCFAALSMT